MNSAYPTLFSVALSVVLILSGCASSRRSEVPEGAASTVRVKKVNSFSEMNISFKTDRGMITYEVNPDDEDIFITMKGGNAIIDTGTAVDMPLELPQSKASGQMQGTGGTGNTEESKLEQNLPDDVDRTDEVLALIRKAQELFYKKEYEEALKTVDQAIAIKGTAEGHALKGTVYYMLGENGRAEKSWKAALKINPDMPGVDDMIQKVKGGN